MSNQKTIAVVGATGSQGGGLVRAILADPSGEFAVRALTRDASSDQAQALKTLGAEVVQVDMKDRDAVARAFEGCYGAFCVTFFWDAMSPAVELEQARVQADAAKAAGLEHVLWSTLPDAREHFPLDDDAMPTLEGSYKVPHMDAKHEANQFFIDNGVPVTFFQTVFYYDNFINFGLEPVRNAEGTLVLNLPIGEGKLPMIAAEDIGRAALGVFRRGLSTVGATINVIGDHLTGDTIAEEMAAGFGEPVSFQPATPAQYRSFGFPGADELANQFQYMSALTQEYARTYLVGPTRELNPALQSFSEWLVDQAKSIPITPRPA
jgi:uncharacterized protein YbjT (DUF2867 family)